MLRTTAIAALLIPLIALVRVPPVQAAEESAGKAPTFDILEYVVEGNTVLDALAIERAVYRYLGPDRSFEDVSAARGALEQAYQDAGFLTVRVDIPQQRVEDSRVTLRVVEGRVDRLAVTGNRYHERDYIRGAFPALQPGVVPYFPEAQRNLAAFNQTAGRGVTPILKPGRAPGTVDMELRVEDRSPFHASVELNNRQTATTKPLRLAASFRFDNLWGRDHSLSLLFFGAPQALDEVKSYSANYLFRVPDSRNLVAVYAVRSRSDVVALGGTNVLGDADIVGARAILPLPGKDKFTHNAILGLDYKNSLQATALGGQTASRSEVAYVPVSGQYAFTSTGGRGTTRGSATMTLGVGGAIFGNRDAEFEARRKGARSNFATLRLDASRLQTLSRGLSLFGRASAHLASQPLLNTEQFIAAGVDTVRGYFEAEAVGDVGWNASLELRSASLLGVVEGAARELVAVGFVDAAWVNTLNAQPGEIARRAPWSAGVGLRFTAERRWNATLDVGVPMEDAQRTRAGEPRVHFRVAYDY